VAFGTIVTPSVSVFGELQAFLWKPRGECPGAVPILVCHDEVVVECDSEQAADAKAWLEKAMIGGMKAVLNSTDQVDVSVGVHARIATSWGEGI
jgi:hypothetical protein